jgi:hypothetical protein
MALVGQQGRPARFSERVDCRVGDEAKGLARTAGPFAAADGDLEIARAVGVTGAHKTRVDADEHAFAAGGRLIDRWAAGSMAASAVKSACSRWGPPARCGAARWCD